MSNPHVPCTVHVTKRRILHYAGHVYCASRVILFIYSTVHFAIVIVIAFNNLNTYTNSLTKRYRASARDAICSGTLFTSLKRDRPDFTTETAQ